MSADIAQTGNICRHHEMSADIARLQMCANIYILCARTAQVCESMLNQASRDSLWLAELLSWNA